MAEPTPIERAEALIRANPRERAAYELGRDLGFADGYFQGWQDSPEGDPEAYDDSNAKAAAYLLLAETPPEPARVWTVDKALTLCARTTAHKEAIERARAAVDDALFEAYRDLDPTARAATEGALRGACERLAALLPEVPHA